MLIWICLIALMIGLPLSKGVATSAMLSLLGLSLIKMAIERSSPIQVIRDNLPLLGLCTLYICYLISLLYSQNISHGLAFIEREIPLLILPVIIVINRKVISEKLIQLLILFVIACSFAAIVTLLFYFLPEDESISWASRLSFLNIKPYVQLSKREAFGVYSPFLDRLQFSNLLAIAVIGCLYIGTKTHRYLFGGFAFLLLFTSAILGGKGGQLGLMAGLFIWFTLAFFQVVYPRWRAKFSRLGAIIGFIGLLGTLGIGLPYILYKNVPAVTQRYNQMKWELETFYSEQSQEYDYVHFTTIRRILSWANSWELIQSQPLLGAGVGDYHDQMTAIYAKNSPDFPVNSHNHYLFVWANCGIWGLLSFLGSIFFWCRSLSTVSKPQALAYPLSILVIFLTIMLFDSLISQVDTMAFGMFLSFGFLSGNMDPKKM